MAIVYSSLNHALRVPLAAEVHSRPFLRLDAPESLTHLAIYLRAAEEPSSPDGALQHAKLAALCTHFGERWSTRRRLRKRTARLALKPMKSRRC